MTTNKEIFLQIATSRIKRQGITEMLQFLEQSDFYTAPASARYHLCVEGGLLQHSLNVYNRLLKLYAPEFGEPDDSRQETLAIIALFHDVCKIDYYVPEWRNKKVYSENGSRTDAGGRFDWEVVQGYAVSEKFSYGHHGAKSTYLIERFMRLTPEEAVCITNHMGAYDRAPNDYTLNGAYTQYPLALLLHTADNFASVIDEKN